MNDTLDTMREDALLSHRLTLRELAAKAVLAAPEEQVEVWEAIEKVEEQKQEVLREQEVNLAAKQSEVEAQLQRLRDEGAPASMWVRAHRDRQLMELEQERNNLLEQRRLNLAAQRDVLDKKMNRLIGKLARLRGESHPGDESEFAELGNRRRDVLRALNELAVDKPRFIHETVV